MKNLCTICMRGGSKGVPNKNFRNLLGKPLMAYTIEKAIESGLFEHVVVSTDSEKISETAKSFGAEAWFLRPPELATDQTPKLPVIRHAVLESEKYYGHKFDILTDLDATSPLRNMEDIKGAYTKFLNEDSDVLITASLARKNPYFNMVEIKDGSVNLVKHTDLSKPLISPKASIPEALSFLPSRRQDAPEVYDMNASIYIWKRQTLLESSTLFAEKTSLYVMPAERSIDIDTELDWEFVEFIMLKKMKNND
tara:strand:+ start:135 stop:890 length:756 start_codon:yes stop_codon:yes gene_type:complete